MRKDSWRSCWVIVHHGRSWKPHGGRADWRRWKERDPVGIRTSGDIASGHQRKNTKLRQYLWRRSTGRLQNRLGSRGSRWNRLSGSQIYWWRFLKLWNLYRAWSWLTRLRMLCDVHASEGWSRDLPHKLWWLFRQVFTCIAIRALLRIVKCTRMSIVNNFAVFRSRINVPLHFTHSDVS